ncbi:MAG: hypothetical protein WBM70_11225 [Sulfurovum sp.]|uniref:hypothetical protein n=1 Tax=Sulfurovum sp. TaxID=1969726 RepID=UPI003C74E916
MDKRNLISVTLLVTALAFNPLFAEHTLKTNLYVKENRVTSKISSILHKRGLDEDAAKELSENLVNEDEELFVLMIDNLLHGCNDLNKDEILEYLSTAALHRQNVELDSYAQLVSMVSKIKQKLLDEKTLEQLSIVAKSNAHYVKSYRLFTEKTLLT